jgi:hypothetical protein
MKKIAVMGVSGMMLIFSLTFTGCDTDSTSNTGGNVIGTWSGTVNGHPGSITVGTINWTFSVQGAGFYDAGTYAMANNIAILSARHDDKAVNVGMAYVIGGNTMCITLNSNSAASGTYLLTRKSYYGLQD